VLLVLQKHRDTVVWLQTARLRGLRFLSKDKINIISNENLSGEPQIGIDARYKFLIAKGLAQVFPEAKIILGVRGSKSWLRSIYYQYVKQGGIHDFDNWYDIIFDEDNLDFNRYIDCLQSLFNDVLIYKYEDMKKNMDGVIKDICDFIGVDVPVYENIRTNVSMSENMMKLVRFLNQFQRSDLNHKGFFKKNRHLNTNRVFDWYPHLKNRIQGGRGI